jgi:hypothetical protein
MSMELTVPVRRPRAVVVLVIAIAIAAISAAAAWTILSPAGAIPRPAGVPGYEVVAGTPLTVSPSNSAVATVLCSSGKKPLGGGASNELDTVGEGFAVLTASAPTVAGDGWRVHVKSEATIGDITMTPYAVCATA